MNQVEQETIDRRDIIKVMRTDCSDDLYWYKYELKKALELADMQPRHRKTDWRKSKREMYNDAWNEYVKDWD